MADKPVTREEKYLAHLTGDYTGEIPKPITRKEKYLYELCLKGIGGEISPEEIKAAVNEYLEKNPVKPGATTEQAQQIEQNKTDVASLKEDINNVKKSMDGHLSGGYASSFEVNTTTGDVYIRDGNIDIFYGTGGKFKRFYIGEKLCTITSTTSSSTIMYIPSTDSVVYGDSQPEGIVIATCIGRVILPNNGITVKYTDGKNQYNPYLTGIKLDEHTRDISDLKASIGIDLPTFVLNTAKNTFKRLINWIGSDDACLVAFVTDVHSGGNTKYKHVRYLSELNKLFGFDILVNGGDIGTDFSTDQSIENENVDNELITNTKLGMDCTSPWVLCKGNHERTVATAKIGASFNKCLR
jgi:hypothetical protein|nr:MAG TPA: hypothetical protein [Caudoviricetes sp.]